MIEFLSMSGYAAFVWPSIGLGIGVLLLNIHWARKLHAQAKAEARRRLSSGGEA